MYTPKVNISPSTGWNFQTKVTTPAINHNNHPTSAPKVGQMSQAETMRRTMNTMRAKGITSDGTGVGY